MPIVENQPKQNTSAKILSGTFAAFIILAVILSFTIDRDADPKYPTLWKEYKSDKLRFDYPGTWDFKESIVTENFFEGEKNNDLETLVFELKGTPNGITVTIIPKIEENILEVVYPEITPNTVYENNSKKFGDSYEYASDKPEQYVVLIKGFYSDKRAAENMKKIVQHMGEDVRNPSRLK